MTTHFVWNLDTPHDPYIAACGKHVQTAESTAYIGTIDCEMCLLVVFVSWATVQIARGEQ